jgi:uncharacterized membrane protein
MNQGYDHTFLSSAVLKDRAKETLSGRYGQAILAGFLIGVITLACQFTLSFLDSLLFYLILIARDVFGNGLSLEQLQLLINEGAYLEEFPALYSAMDYLLSVVLNFFLSVFNVGFSLFCLNLACGRRVKVSDIFYGFQYQFGKSFKLAALTVLVGQLCYLPANILSYFLRQDASVTLIVTVLLLWAVCIAVYIPLSLSLSQVFLLLLDFPGYTAGELIKLSIRIMRGHKRRLFYIQLSFIPLMLLGLLSFGIGNLWLTPYMNVTYTFFFLNLMQARQDPAV